MSSPAFKQKLSELWEGRAFRFATGALVAGVFCFFVWVSSGPGNSLMPSMPSLAGPASSSQNSATAPSLQRPRPSITGVPLHTDVDLDIDSPELPEWDY